VIIAHPRLPFTRAGIIILLAILVALLGAAAKHSLFDGPPHHGYLSKAVKMDSARVDPNVGMDAGQYPAPVTQALGMPEEPLFSVPSFVRMYPILLLSPPIRV
jgi:hypothetical protein